MKGCIAWNMISDAETPGALKPGTLSLEDEPETFPLQSQGTLGSDQIRGLGPNSSRAPSTAKPFSAGRRGSMRRYF